MPAPPIIQMFFPFFSRTRAANRLIGSLTNSTPAGAGDGSGLQIERHIACLAAPEDRVDGFIERTHAVVALRTRTVEPVDGAVESANKAVGAGGDVDDDFALADHGGTGSGQILTRSTLGFPSNRVREEGGSPCTSPSRSLRDPDFHHGLLALEKHKGWGILKLR